ncbi:hypothetical protein HHI36_009371 [Cryptolaemus montrouzieri]|uniref:Uncharacterized protein n=1 Tax=Cryptolaemus montrouzieri TaxID=559131 RepID=A0ABD2MVW8_9CUCU
MKRAKKVQDKDKPKRPQTAFMLWLNENRSKIKSKNPDMKVTEIAKEGGRLWRELEDKSNSKISDKRLCIDPDCKSPVSIAKTLTRYFSPEAYMLSFKANEEITIFSKSAGSNEDLWGAEIKGKRGYVPRGLVRETKIIGKPLLLVDTEIGYNSNATQVPIEKEAVKPSKVKQTYEIIDGTTVYPQLDEDIIEEAQEPSWSTENISEKNIDILESSKADNLEISLSPNVESTINHSKKESLSDATSENDTVNSVNVDNQESNQIEVENIENSQIEPINIHNEENNLNLNSESKEDDAGYLSGMFDNVLGMVMGDKDEETGKESEVDVKKGDEFVEKELDGTSSNATPEKDRTSSIPTPEKDFDEIVGDSLENKTEKTPELFSDGNSEVLTDSSANNEKKDAIDDFLHNVEKKDSTDMNTVNIVSESVVSSENSLNEVETISASSEESKIENSQTNSESNSPTYSESNSPTDLESNSPTFLESNSPTNSESNSPTNSESNSIENKIEEEKLYENSTGSENLLQKVGEIVKENEAISNNSSEIMNDIDENLSKNEEIKQDDSHIEKNPSYGTLNSIDDYVKNEEKLLPRSTIEQVNQNSNLTLNNSQVETLEILSSSEPQNDVLEVSSNFLENTELGNSENDTSVENISNTEDKKVSLPVVSQITQNDFENIKFKDKLLEVGDVIDENNQNFEIKPENDINQVSEGKMKIF